MLDKLILILLYCIQNGLRADGYYKAAVVDYKTKFSDTLSPEQNLLTNIQEYDRITSSVKKEGVEIIVFPEYGVTGLKIPQIKHYFLPYTIFIPYSNEVFCDENDDVSIILKRLSCIAKRNEIYIVLNLAEREENCNKNGTQEYFFYNTDVVFDRHGRIIAKYRKVNLYGENAFDPNIDRAKHLVTFSTDFNVTFGIMTCFDILFYNPSIRLVEKDITDFVFPTAWMSELPFLTALQVQSGWARTNRVNLLASNRLDAISLSGGSGIYSAKEGNLNYTIPEDGDDTKVLIANVPKIKKNDESNLYYKEIRNSDIPKYIPKVANMENYTLEVITRGELNNYNLNYKTLNCYFDIKIKDYEQSESDYDFRLVAYEGIIYLGEALSYIKTCGVISCLNHSRESCGHISKDKTKFHQFEKIKIRSNINKHERALTFPSVIGYDLYPIPFENYDFKYHEMELKKPIENLITFGIYQKIDVSSAKITNASIKVLLFLFCLRIVL